jgi:DUF438 domain-containing protein
MSVGQINCSKHSLQAISFVSPKIRDAILAGVSKTNSLTVRRVPLNVFDVMGIYPMDIDFCDEHEIFGSQFLDEDASERIFEKLHPVCRKCLEELPLIEE